MDKRLLTCAGLCVGDRIADIGTDHGYLPCYMVSNGLCKTALACDIAEKPLDSAVQHIKAQGLEQEIQTILTDGLKDVPSSGVTDVVIAGMGGEMIADILKDCRWVRDNKVNLVLQPMTKWDFLRKWLYENNFAVKHEHTCKEGKFVYSVIQAEYIGKRPDYKCDLRYLYCGFVNKDQPDGEEYIARQAKRLETAGKGMMNDPEKAEQAEEMLKLALELQGKKI